MAKKYRSIEEINKISNAKSAVAGDFYYDTEGNTYIGTTIGNLIVVADADHVPFTSKSGLAAETVRAAIDEVNVKDNDMYSTAEIDAKIESARCLTLALSVAL